MESVAPRTSSARSRPATAEDVARLAGVSRSAVSRTFTEGASVSEATRQRVVEAARALKYRPNLMARSLMTNRSFMVGVAVSHLDNQFYPEVVEQLSDQLGAIGYRVLLFITHGNTELDPMLDELLRYRVDALILASSSLSSALAEECRQGGVPVIMFNNTDLANRTPAVAGDNTHGAAMAADFLWAAGHRRFGFIAGIEESSTSREREAGFKDALRRHGADRPMRACGHFTFDGAMAATRQLLSAPTPPEALFCTNDHMALAAIEVARSEFGLTPGRELSIVGFDDVAIAAWPGFQLTTYSQPVAHMVARTVGLVKDALAGTKDGQCHHIIQGDLIVRASARRPATGIVRTPEGQEIWRRA
ncbi:LacI family DNA-binding transcriptional regulator [Nitrospirillum iridis]|uniref:DNA-binding LacI/PurR family transcriptional regulator n=1 Tax=Nitrospirillum iridis TaxID=765888 RepID=A0A7X0B1H6_9PROT|nr:LacI family DNA-binding transcriptional regulator [Nitrospirillum iridis]MBB6253256.1 DNA-binding LacI/PurR family transcriptional regulator [Nitrospirillum iridis]